MALLLLISSCFSLFLWTLPFFHFLFFNLFFEPFCKNLSLLLFISCFFFSFSVFFGLFLSHLFSFFVVYILFVNIVFSESSSFKCVYFPSFFDSLFWSLGFDPFFLRNNLCLSSVISLFLVLSLVHHFLFSSHKKTILFFVRLVFLFLFLYLNNKLSPSSFLFFLLFFLNSLSVFNISFFSLFLEFLFFFPFFSISLFPLVHSSHSSPSPFLFVFLFFFRHHSLRFVISFSLYLSFLGPFFSLSLLFLVISLLLCSPFVSLFPSLSFATMPIFLSPPLFVISFFFSTAFFLYRLLCPTSHFRHLRCFQYLRFVMFLVSSTSFFSFCLCPFPFSFSPFFWSLLIFHHFLSFSLFLSPPHFSPSSSPSLMISPSAFSFSLFPFSLSFFFVRKKSCSSTLFFLFLCFSWAHFSLAPLFWCHFPATPSFLISFFLAAFCSILFLEISCGILICHLFFVCLSLKRIFVT